MKRLIFLLTCFGFVFAQQPFQNLEGAVGYIVIERQGKVENYIVVEEKDGSVRNIRVDRNPSQFMKKTEEQREGGKK
ncbi:hypothetical protein [Pampinifervens florentissimum]|uniref:hypothetical protein n=1 Tax=Pampinifervens florentissimum TaxID=1632019 RepID=UPI0013B489BF|nr:hypothetical protein [Hydrogenobacter sp. T-8]QID32494.1 hypothetical protein G3M65_01335 [Hydrogenobacter sp. T-8]